MTTPKKLALELKQVLDLDDKKSKIIFAFGLINIIIMLATSHINADLLSLSIQHIVNLLFLLYVLACFKNGGCHIITQVFSAIILVLFVGESILRICAGTQ